MIVCRHDYGDTDGRYPCPRCADEERIRELEEQVEALGQRLCEFHDTNPLNATVAELEGQRNALAAALREINALPDSRSDEAAMISRRALTETPHWSEKDAAIRILENLWREQPLGSREHVAVARVLRLVKEMG